MDLVSEYKVRTSICVESKNKSETKLCLESSAIGETNGCPNSSIWVSSGIRFQILSLRESLIVKMVWRQI